MNRRKIKINLIRVRSTFFFAERNLVYVNIFSFWLNEDLAYG